MYNQNEKRAFGYKYRNTKIEDFFEFSEKYEMQAGKDLCCFPHDELLCVLKDFHVTLAATKKQQFASLYCLQVRKYIGFMREKQIVDLEIPSDSAVYAWEVLDHKAVVKDSKMVFFSPDVIKDYAQILPSRYAFVLYACYEGFRGENGLEFLTLMANDVDLAQRRVHLKNDLVPISLNCANVISRILKDMEYRKAIFKQFMRTESEQQLKTNLRQVMYQLRAYLGFEDNVISARNLLTSGLCVDLYMRGYLNSPNNFAQQLLKLKRSPLSHVIFNRYEAAIETTGQWRYVRQYLLNYLSLYYEDIARCVSDKEFD